MPPTMNLPQVALIEMAIIARGFPHWKHQQYVADCTRCGSPHAAMSLWRFPDSARASFACGGCRWERDAWVDAA
jgi:hypothetical protein